MGKKIAFMFPGQGAQSVGMGKDLYDNYDAAKDVFNAADKILGRSISSVCFAGPEEDLKQTFNTQPAIVATSIAALESFKSQFDIKPSYTAGHSLGEYCAMYASGVMDLEVTMKLIQKRAELMGKTEGGSMAAVLSAPDGAVEEALKEASSVGYVDVANYNSPAQVVITGDSAAVTKAGEILTAKGAKRIVPLAVSGAFHSKFMEPAGKEFAEYLKDFSLSDASVPVVTNVDAEFTTSGAEFGVKMPKQIYSSVYWTQSIEKMVQDGVEIFIEIGPGKVLAGLVKKIAPQVKIFNIFDKTSMDATIEALKAEFCGV